MREGETSCQLGEESAMSYRNGANDRPGSFRPDPLAHAGLQLSQQEYR